MTHGIKDSEAHVSFQCSIVLKYRTVQTIAVFGLLSNLGLESAFSDFNWAIGKTEYLEFNKHCAVSVPKSPVTIFSIIANTGKH